MVALVLEAVRCYDRCPIPWVERLLEQEDITVFGMERSQILLFQYPLIEGGYTAVSCVKSIRT